MITDFQTLLNELHIIAMSVSNVIHSSHIGAGELIIARLQKYYEAEFKEGIAIFIDSSEGVLTDNDSSNVKISFDLGFTFLKKGKLSDVSTQDVALNSTMKTLVEFVGKLKHFESENEENDNFEILVDNKFSQTGKIVNADVYGWRAEAKVSFSVNHLYCNHG
ncbi:MAG: hypothetical protein MUF12_00645 [Sediminibacterium sp.]|jgi:hypothetical protein|nr:hypothetical protein [Sediminibacterium sp.]